MTGVGAQVEAGFDTDEETRRFPALIGALVFVTLLVPVGLWWLSARTSASFADDETLENNVLGAATLDIEVGNADIELSASNMAPGDSVTGHIELTNVGTLPLVFGVEAQASDTTLSEWLLFDAWLSGAACHPDGRVDPLLVSGVALPAAYVMLVEPTLPLEPGESINLCIGATLPLAAPNEVQGSETDVDLIVAAVHDLEASE